MTCVTERCDRGYADIGIGRTCILGVVQSLARVPAFGMLPSGMRESD